MEKDAEGASEQSSPSLCASCDRCRARKTKCDGNRPCGNCATKYMKKHKVTSVATVPFEAFECVYSPAKRRGPIPGRAAGQARKASEMRIQQMVSGGGGQSEHQPMTQPSAPSSTSTNFLLQQQQQQQQQLAQQNAALLAAQQPTLSGTQSLGSVDQAQLAALLGQGVAGTNPAGFSASNAATIQQQIAALQQQMQQQQQQQQQKQQQSAPGPGDLGMEEPSSRRVKLDASAQPQQEGSGIPRTILSHTHLLERSDPEGARLRAFYRLSVDELFRLPPTPTDEEYCARLNIPSVSPSMIPGSHLAALSAVRFAEAALGAIVHNEVSLAMELCNAVVHCLRESVQEPVQTPILFEVAKAYFLLGVFRAFRGDMPRYFKYRRVCMTYLSKLEDDERTQTLLAAISYLDSWAYMIYNADEKALPNVDETVPPVQSSSDARQSSFESSKVEAKFNVKCDPCSIACDPMNKNWIQGAPPVYLNNEAPLHSRVLDALACAVRTCCDQANGRFAAIAKEANEPEMANQISQECIMTPTTTAVLANENELCSRNMVLSAYTLMQQNEALSGGQGAAASNDNSTSAGRFEGQRLVISAMDAFLENSDESSGGFSDNQIQSLLSVCNSAVENPFLLHHAGPTYHMVTNAAVLLCHLLNGMYAMKQNNQFGPMEATMFEEVLDTFVSVRKLLTIHRRKLPVKLRCHGIPRPNLELFGKSSADGGPKPFIDLGETLLCACRGCQGFVLMACSPCVAAERARSAQNRMEVAAAQESEALDLGEFGGGFQGIDGSEFDLDDDALLGMISGLITN